MNKRGFFNSRAKVVLRLGLIFILVLSPVILLGIKKSQATSTANENYSDNTDLKVKIEPPTPSLLPLQVPTGSTVNYKIAAYWTPPYGVSPDGPKRVDDPKLVGQLFCYGQTGTYIHSPDKTFGVGNMTSDPARGEEMWMNYYNTSIYNNPISPYGSYTGSCSYPAAGTYWPMIVVDSNSSGHAYYSMRVVVGGGTANQTITPTPLVPHLDARLFGGTGGVAPYSSRNTSYASSNVPGSYSHYFYCNRSDSGTNTTTPAPFETALAKFQSSWTMVNACSYSNPGTYSPKVIVKQGTLSAESRMNITVTQPSTVINANLVANPSPSDTTKTVTLSATGNTNNVTDTFNYSFWWNCASSASNYAQAVTDCGAPTNASIGAKFSNLSSATVTKSTQHLYNQSGTLKPKVIIEQGNASSTKNIALNVVNPPSTASIAISPSPYVSDKIFSIVGNVNDPTGAVKASTFNFWWNCDKTITSVADAIAKCGQPRIQGDSNFTQEQRDTGFIFTQDNVSQKTSTRNFPTGTRTIKLLVERDGGVIQATKVINVQQGPQVSPKPSIMPSPKPSASPSKTTTVTSTTTMTAGPSTTPIIIPSLDVDLNLTPAESTPGQSVSLNAITSTNTKAGSYSYYFWWNCDSPSASAGLQDIKNKCGDPSVASVGAQFTNLSSSIISKSVDHIYTSANLYKPLVYVEHSSVNKLSGALINVIKPTLTAGLIINPTTADGSAKPATLTASAGGPATGSVNYTFWWNCDESGSDIQLLTGKCGDPNNSSIGARFTANVNQKTVNQDYIQPGTFYPKVVVERGSADPQEARKQITINAIPIPTLNVSIGATKTSAENILPAKVDITANISGNATGSTNYKIWWDCQPNTQDFSQIESICGSVTDPTKGTTLSSADGILTAKASTSYSLSGLRHPFVLAQRQSIKAFASTEINIPPIIVPDTLTATLSPSSASIKKGETVKLTVATQSNNSKDSYNYYFWWDCPNADSKVLGDVVAACSNPNGSVVGQVFMGQSSSTTTKETSHKYDSAKRNYPRIFVEHGTVSANISTELIVTDIRADETPTPTPTSTVMQSPSPSPTPSVTPSIAPTALPSPSITAVPSPSRTVTSTPTPTATPPPDTLTVRLASDPDSGYNLLKDVTLTASTSGTAKGTLNYTFYCNRADDGSNITEGYASKFDGVNETEKVLAKACSYEKSGAYTAKVIVERGNAPAVESRATINVKQSSGIRLKELSIKAFPEATKPNTAIKIKVSAIDIYGNAYDDNGHQEGAVKLDGLQIFLSLPDPKAGKLGSNGSSTFVETSENIGTYPIEGSATFEDQVLKQSANITVTNEIPVLTSVLIKARDSFLNQIIPGTNNFRVKPSGYLRLMATPLDQFGQWFPNASMKYELSSAVGSLQPNGLIQAGQTEGTFENGFRAVAMSSDKTVESAANIIVTNQVDDNGVCKGGDCPVPTDPTCNPCPDLANKVCKEKPLVCIGRFCVLPACKEPNCTSKSVCIGSYCLQSSCLSEVTKEDCPPPLPSPTPTPASTVLPAIATSPTNAVSPTSTSTQTVIPTPMQTEIPTQTPEVTAQPSAIISNLKVEINPDRPQLEKLSTKQFNATVYLDNEKIAETLSVVPAATSANPSFEWSAAVAGTVNQSGLFTAGSNSGDYDNAVRVNATVIVNGQPRVVVGTMKVIVRDKVCIGNECDVCPDGICSIGGTILPRVIGETINAVSPHNTSIPPVAGAVALVVLAATALAPIVANAGTISGLVGRSSNLFFFLPFGPKRRKNFGTVVDASTGFGVSGIIVEVINLETGKEVLRSTTDKLGRFSIMVPSGKYMLNIPVKDYQVAELPGFYKPKATIEISQSAKSPVAPRIAILQSSKTLSNKLKVVGALDVVQKIVFPVSTIALLWGTYVTYMQIPQRTTSGNTIIFTFYAMVWGIWLASLLKRKFNNFGVVKSSSGPIERAVVRIFDKNNRLISTTVSDKDGKFSVMLPRGEYQIKVMAPGMVQVGAVNAIVKEELGPVSANIQLRKA